MNKQIIRLTESDLHQMITEAVKTTLNELDWKTYMSAAQKRRAQGQHGKANDLAQYSNKQFQSQYDLNNASEDNGMQSNTVHPFRTRVSDTGGRIGWNQETHGWNNPDRGVERYHEKNYGDWEAENPNDDYEGNNSKGYSNNLSKRSEPRQYRNTQYLPTSQQFKGQLNKMTNDVSNFYNGKSQYNKGQGWQ